MTHPDREVAIGQVRAVVNRLVRDGAATARSDGTVWNGQDSTPRPAA